MLKKPLSKTKTYLCAFLVGLFVFCSVNLAVFAGECAEIRGNVVRLHILANSDSDADQALKLQVRDAILAKSDEIFGTAQTAAQAAAIIETNLDGILRIASDTLRGNDSDYSVAVKVANEYYPTRVYENYTLPAGYYTGLKVFIGEGAGHNWWCVMFPPLCISAAAGEEDLDAVLTDEEVKIVGESKKYAVRFKIVEIFETLREKLHTHEA